MSVNLIVAISENYAIGNKNDIPWHIPEDFKLFKENTLNSSIIMGRKTWDSLPFKPLPKRENIVISRDKNNIVEDSCIKADSLNEAIEIAKKLDKEIFIIGGASIYKQSLDENLIDYMYISHVNINCKADTFFPKFDEDNWSIIGKKDFDKFTFKKYKKIN